MKDLNDSSITVRVSEKLKREFEAILHEEELKSSQVLRKYIKDYVRKHKQEVDLKDK